MKKIYKYNNIKICYTDTDSLLYLIYSEDFYKDMKDNIKYFDTSNFPENNIYHIPKANKQKPGYFKDELGGDIITEFIGLKAKLYCVNTLKSAIKKAKCVKKHITKKLTIENYRDILNSKKLCPSEALNNSVFIFDVVACENQINNRNYFSMGRHKQIDCFYLSHTYSKIPKQLLRDNANFIIIFKLNLNKMMSPQRNATKHGPEPPASIDFLHVLPGRHSNSLGSPYTSPIGMRLSLNNLSSPSVVGSSSYMAGPLSLQLINPLGYVGYSGYTADILISEFITQRNPEHSPLHSSLSDLELPHTASSEGPRLRSVSRHWQHALVVQFRFKVFSLDNETIFLVKIGDKSYNLTIGLRELLLRKKPDLNLVSSADKLVYKNILDHTNAHKRDFNPRGQIRGDKGIKYQKIIKPLFFETLIKYKKIEEKLGGNLPKLKKYKINTGIVYWDDPNELVDRLKVLIASRDAGNTNHDNEILSIIEELKEANIIKE
ncbi:unnamed protein product [Parnassius mnemosyne]|uniref:DUF8207 domain-containing protein n=1 Tax=Parnassius mnemosyne TaxID=213953 RepID=A0AAV1LXS8_9NEOP